MRRLWPGGRRRSIRQCRGERGAASTELVIATPLLLVLILLVVQFAMYLHAVHVAQAAAAQALAVARAENSDAAAGNNQADTVLAQLGRSVLTEPQVTVQRGTAEARVEVAGAAQSVLPFLRLPVRVVAHGPVERFVPAA